MTTLASTGKSSPVDNTQGFYQRLLRPLLFRFDPESVHEFALRVMRFGGAPLLQPAVRSLYAFDDQKLAVRLFGRVFPNPLGLAAGFDKNAVALPFLSALGFGHIELGTVTPRPQVGNPRPRIFRLPQDGGVINRMGFPSHGVERVLQNLPTQKNRAHGSLIGINVGKNKETPLEEAVNDYRQAIEALHPYADYLVINVSSPNTPQLRELQKREPLSELIRGVQEVNPNRLPLVVKVAPDLEWKELDDVLLACSDTNVSALIATNTTFSREGLITSIDEQGGLSGKPLFTRSRDVVRYIYTHTNGELPVIAAGGVSTAPDVIEMMKSGASLVQIYTGFIYEGPSLAKRVKQDLVRFLDREGLRSVHELIGVQ